MFQQTNLDRIGPFCWLSEKASDCRPNQRATAREQFIIRKCFALIRIVADFTEIGLANADIAVQQTPQESTEQRHFVVDGEHEYHGADHRADDASNHTRPPANLVCKTTPEDGADQLTDVVRRRQESGQESELTRPQIRIETGHHER